jgi:hypothetical protein
MSKKNKPNRLGNPVARSPLLRKGGVHQRSRSGERQRDKRALAKKLKAYLSAASHEKARFPPGFFLGLST